MTHYTPFLPEVIADPYPIYRSLLEQAPAYYIEEYDSWALSRFDDLWRALSDAETFGTTGGTTAAQAVSKVEAPVPSINQLDPPDHTRLRKAVSRSFTKNRVKALEPEIRALACDLLDRGESAGEIDVVRGLADPVAAQVACRLLDLPLEDGPLLVEWVHRYVSNDPDDQGRSADALAAAGEMNEYLAAFARDRRKNPRRDDAVVEAFLAFELDGRRLEDLEIASHLQTLVIGGTDTTPKGIGAAVLRLYQHPDQRARLAADPSRIPTAFTEVLRYDMPTQFMARTVNRRVVLHDQTLEPGQGVLLLLAAGNRDPREFDDPDRFDIDRDPRRILSFGHAVHICLGAHVARLEGRVLLEELLGRHPEYGLDESRLEWRRADQIQGLISAPIEIRGSEQAA
jgi:cytochrome P450